VFDDFRTYINIEIGVPVEIMFEDDEPARTRPDSFGTPQHLFNVNNGEILGIVSKPLMRALKPFTPLGGKTLLITRTGKGYETGYKVEAVK